MLIPPDRELRISDDEISAVPFEEPADGAHRLTIFFFPILADQHGDGVAMILSGRRVRWGHWASKL